MNLFVPTGLYLNPDQAAACNSTWVGKPGRFLNGRGRSEVRMEEGNRWLSLGAAGDSCTPVSAEATRSVSDGHRGGEMGRHGREEGEDAAWVERIMCSPRTTPSLHTWHLSPLLTPRSG